MDCNVAKSERKHMRYLLKVFTPLNCYFCIFQLQMFSLPKKGNLQSVDSSPAFRHRLILMLLVPPTFTVMYLTGENWLRYFFQLLWKRRNSTPHWTADLNKRQPLWWRLTFRNERRIAHALCVSAELKVIVWKLFVAPRTIRVRLKFNLLKAQIQIKDKSRIDLFWKVSYLRCSCIYIISLNLSG